MLNGLKSVTNKPFFYQDKRIFSHVQHLTLIISRVNGFIQLQLQQQPERMRWISLIRTSKSNIFQHLRKSVRKKAARLSGKVLLWCLHLIWTHTSDSFCRPWEFTTWRKWFTCPNPPSCLIPWGAGAEVGAMLGYQSVFLPSIPSLFFLFSLLCLGRPFCNLRLSKGPPSAKNSMGLYETLSDGIFHKKDQTHS